MALQSGSLVKINGVEAGQENGQYVAYFPEDKELLNDQRDYIINIMENYARYMINRGNPGVLRSFMVGKASEYMSDIKYIHVYLLGQSFNYSIKNQNVTNFRKYSQECFSCQKTECTLRATLRFRLWIFLLWIS